MHKTHGRQGNTCVCDVQIETCFETCIETWLLQTRARTGMARGTQAMDAQQCRIRAQVRASGASSALASECSFFY